MTNSLIDGSCLCDYLVPIFLFGLLGVMTAFGLYCGLKIMRFI